MKIIVTTSDRIDKYITLNSEFSRNEIKNLILEHAVYVNEKLVRKPKFICKEGDEIEIKKLPEKELNVIPEDLPITIIYEDDDLIIVNKASGMVVHPAPGHRSGTLVNALLFHFNQLSDLNGLVRPGIVHRIDKDTSGLLIVAKNNKAHKILAEMLKNHDIKRKYIALIKGRMENKVTHIDLPIGRDPIHRKRMAVQKNNAKHAITHIFVETIYEDYSRVRCELETGRTHQIRVHLSYLKHPVLGDPLYGSKIDDFNQRLHAYELEFVHPTTKKIMNFKAEVPDQFEL
jgi:23S rRNA pseudouridine1911/1915/1917 synthase